MNQRNQLIGELYPELKRVARRVIGRDHEDLLHETLIMVLNSKTAPETKTELFAYCVKSLKQNSTSVENVFHRKIRRWKQQRSDIENFIETKPNIDNSARADNETIDLAINLLPELERKVFLLWAFSDFSYVTLSKETGIKRDLLYNAVNSAKTQLRQYVTR